MSGAEEPGARFADAAAWCAGAAGLWFGWAPETFWNATPAELSALVRAATGDMARDGTAAMDAATLMRLKEQFPDG